MKTSSFISRRSTLLSLILIFSVVVTGCKITQVSEYDEQTDKAVTKFHKDLILFLDTLDKQTSPDCLSANHQAFYHQISADLRTLLIRAESIPNNSLTTQSVSLLINSVSALEKQHNDSCMPSLVIDTNKSNFEIHIRAILKLELAKKRGE